MSASSRIANHNRGYGNGKCDPLTDPHDSPTFRALQTGKPGKGIEISEGPDGAVRIARRLRIAGNAAEIEIKRLYRRKPDGGFALFYAVQGDWEGATLGEIRTIADLLQASFQADYEEKMLEAAPTATDAIGIRLSFRHRAVYLYVGMKFEKPWEPGADFTEIG